MVIASENLRYLCPVHKMDYVPKTEVDADECSMWSLRAEEPGSMQMKVLVKNVPPVIELDTGACVSIVRINLKLCFPGRRWNITKCNCGAIPASSHQF